MSTLDPICTIRTSEDGFTPSYFPSERRAVEDRSRTYGDDTTGFSCRNADGGSRVCETGGGDEVLDGDRSWSLSLWGPTIEPLATIYSAVGPPATRHRTTSLCMLTGPEQKLIENLWTGRDPGFGYVRRYRGPILIN